MGDPAAHRRIRSRGAGFDRPEGSTRRPLTVGGSARGPQRIYGDGWRPIVSCRFRRPARTARAVRFLGREIVLLDEVGSGTG